MMKALKMILELKQNSLPKVEVSAGNIFNVDWRTAIEVSMALTLAELVVRSALQRKETRGHHYRSDFPTTLENPQHTLIEKKKQNFQLALAPVTKLNQ